MSSFDPRSRTLRSATLFVGRCVERPPRQTSAGRRRDPPPPSWVNFLPGYLFSHLLNRVTIAQAIFIFEKNARINQASSLRDAVRSIRKCSKASFRSFHSSSRPHRLTVRTPGFHPGNRSSILREVTTKQVHLSGGLFSCLFSWEKRTSREFRILSKKLFDSI